MPMLRILILDGAEMDNVMSSFELPHFAKMSWRALNMQNMLSGLQLPHLAMVSMRQSGGVMLPLLLKAIKAAAVLDTSGSNELKGLPAQFQAHLPSSLGAHP